MGEFETWAMRGLVVVLGATVGKLIWDRWKRQDSMEAAFKVSLEEQREQLTEALNKQREEWTSAVNTLSSRVATSIDGLNQTVAQLAQSIGELNATTAREYATRMDLKDAKKELREDLQRCAERCPYVVGADK